MIGKKSILKALLTLVLTAVALIAAWFAVSAISPMVIGTPLDNKAYDYLKGVKMYLVGSTTNTWALNDSVFEQNKLKATIPMEHVKDGTNTISVTLSNRKIEYSFKFSSDNINGGPSSLLIKDVPIGSFEDWDNDGVSNEDEQEVYGTDQYKDFSNSDNISDLEYAAKKEGIDLGVPIEASLKFGKNSEYSVNVTPKQPGINKILISDALNQTGIDSAFHISGLTEKSDITIKSYNGASLYKLNSITDIEEIKLKQSDEKDGIYVGKIDTNGDYFVLPDMLDSNENSSGKKQNSKGLIGKQTVVILTDGENSGGLMDFNMDQFLAGGKFTSTAKEMNIQVVVVGLGKANSTYLNKMIQQCGKGAYVYAEDADALSKLKDLIISVITGGSLVEIQDDENVPKPLKVTDVSNSGFLPSVDGFDIENFGSIKSSGGNCYGFTTTALAVYMGATSGDILDNIGQASIIGLLEKMMTDDEVEYIPDVYLPEETKGYLQKGKPWSAPLSIYDEVVAYSPRKHGVINDKHLGLPDSLKSINISDIGVDKLTIDCDDTIQGKKVTSFDKLLIDTEHAMEDETMSSEYCTVAFIGRNQEAQINNMVSNYIKKKDVYTEEMFISTVKRHFDAGTPVPLSIQCNLGGHSVLAYRLYYHEPSSTYYIAVYDSNVPGEEKLIKMETVAVMLNKKLTPTLKLSYTGAGIAFSTYSLPEKIDVPLEGKENLYTFELGK